MGLAAPRLESPAAELLIPALLRMAHRLQGTLRWASAHIPILLHQATCHSPVAFSHSRDGSLAVTAENSVPPPSGGISVVLSSTAEGSQTCGEQGCGDKLVPQEKAPKGACKKQMLYLSLSHFNSFHFYSYVLAHKLHITSLREAG